MRAVLEYECDNCENENTVPISDRYFVIIVNAISILVGRDITFA